METFNTVINTAKNINITAVIDILLVSALLYRIYWLIKETRAEQLLRGIILILLLIPISYMLNLTMVYTIISKTITISLISIIIIFQPEIRRMLEHIGRSAFTDNKFLVTGESLEDVVDEIVYAVDNLSQAKIGALLVIEQDTGLGEIISTGVAVDAVVTQSLIENIFVPNTPLHDGATIIRGNRIAASSCVLPLTENQDINKKLGTRHRAALGLSEVSDALVVIVSEETGTISLALNGKLVRNYERERLRNMLIKIISTKIERGTTWKERIQAWLKRRKETSL